MISRLALGLTRREVRETMTDWRLLLPMGTLALLFPGIMVLGMHIGLPYVSQIDPTLAESKASLFGAIMSAFFPTSFSLIIALESFAGEKERNTLEALLATPISDSELFVGKFLAVMIPPILLCALGLSVYTLGALFIVRIAVPPGFLVLAFLLGVVQALTMVAAAVVVSSQTASVKAANLLASFIIIPVALVVQSEVMLMLAGYGHVLWLVLIEFALLTVALLRLGIRVFNREDILTRENDEFHWSDVRAKVRTVWSQLPANAFAAAPPARFSLLRLFARDIPQLAGLYRGPALMVAGTLLVGMAIGVGFANEHPLRLPGLDMTQMAGAVSSTGDIGKLTPFDIFGHNLRTVALGGLLSVFSFGVAGLVIVVMTGGSIGFFAGQAALNGLDVPQFVLAFLAPHGVLELPALVVAGTLNLWMGMCLITLPKGHSLGDGLLVALVHWVKGAALFVPLLAVAAMLEIWVTPGVVRALYGGQ